MYTKYLKTNKLRLFDVTLRDGLQSIPKVYSLIEKKLFSQTFFADTNHLR